MNDAVVVVGMARTPVASMQGALAEVSAPELGAVAIKAALEKGNVEPEAVDETIMGCVLPAGLGQAPARQASLGAGIPYASASTTINKEHDQRALPFAEGASGYAPGSWPNHRPHVF